jgi:hypothetical protein
MTTTPTIPTAGTVPTVPAAKKRLAPRPTHAQIAQAQRDHYEPQLQTLAEEINALRDELDAARATLAKVRGSWVYAVQYWATGKE